MNKTEMEDWILNILENQGPPLKNVYINDLLEAIILKMDHDETFILEVKRITKREEIIRQYARKNPELLSLHLAIMALLEMHIIDKNEAASYVEKIFEHADWLKERGAL